MQTFPQPRKAIGYGDMQIDCEQAIDDPVRDLIDAAIVSGWPPETVFAALKSVVANRQLAYAEDPDPAPASAP